MNAIPEEIGSQHQPYRRIMRLLIIDQQVDNVKNATVKGWLSAQNSDTFPRDFFCNALLDKGRYIGDRHFNITRGLRA